MGRKKNRKENFANFRKKKDSRGRKIALQSALKMVTSRKQQTVTFVYEESSGGAEEESDDEAKREEKERRRATALSLCQRCRQGTQPDLVGIFK